MNAIKNIYAVLALIALCLSSCEIRMNWKANII